MNIIFNSIIIDVNSGRDSGDEVLLWCVSNRVIRVADHPDSKVAAFISLKTSNEFPFGQLFLATGGSSGNDFTNVVSISLKCRRT